ncbi:MAG: NAD(P)H-dependent oxidoreductase [Candidatus Absconditabacterales bacterium]|nr:NAD(P)H-dependent oxidoreductase [Candidatus Absconditabacterales bacterium]
MTPLIDSLNRRYATKVFDPTRIVSDTDIHTLLEVFRLTPSSFGLQPWKLLVITNNKLKNDLLPHSRNQRQVVDCSHLLVLCANTECGPRDINHFADRICQARGVTRDHIQGYVDMMMERNNAIDSQTKATRAHKQVYIAQGFLLMACAMMKIDSCPMEGFIPAEYNRILGLEHPWTASVVIPIGYRASDDKYATLPKVRFGQEEVVEWRK